MWRRSATSLRKKRGPSSLVAATKRRLPDFPLEELELPTYVQSVLVRAGIETAGQLLEKTPDELACSSPASARRAWKK